ncbi:jerky protein homolog-like [Argiope bruennichi]|uniref:jerky protein homolog-like n=1 Tax=Argiope bruennichi TaxID=94029 RepID=UPI0024952721|nr:jerky protein homolog-like [Argiope bruennichi]XP_055933624.1 jerky protein homolog-like [Argiope bruennichi]
MGDKRRKTVVTMEKKLRAIQQLDTGVTAKIIASELGVGKSTVGDWKRNRSEIEKWCLAQASGSGIKVRKTMLKGKHKEVEEALFVWYEHFKEIGVPVTGPILQKKALEIKRQIEGHDSDFTASDGWLDRWKKRFGIRQITISGEALSADKEAVPVFKDYLLNFIEKKGISEEQLYSCNETGLNYKMLPAKTFVSKKEAAAPGYKKSKERVTILACSNATGNHKLRLTLIGKSKKPRDFKNLESLPVYYKYHEKALMNSEIFKTWFQNEFVPAVEKHLKNNNLPRKALLILDNAHSHPATDELADGDIKALFLPPNVTTISQPMDQAVLVQLKKKFRRRLLSSLISAIDNNGDYVTILKNIDMLDVIRWSSEAWEEIPNISLVRSWKILLDHEDGYFNPEPMCEIEMEDENAKLVALLEKVPGCEDITAKDITDWMANDEIHEITDNDFMGIVKQEVMEEEEQEPLDDRKNLIPHSEGLKRIEAALQYISQQEESTPTDIICLRKWMDIASRKRATM